MPPVPPPPNAPARDTELLRRFVNGGDEAAFELLVWRHSRLVFEVCRRVLRHRHDAEDATQATFLVLARKADTVRSTPAGWLARVAYRCAIRVASGRRESAVARPEQPAHAGRSPEWSDLSAALDAELNRLPDRYRLPVVLCCLHGLSYDEAAARLNWKPGTLSGRLSRAKALLRERLTARGITPTAAGFAAFLAALSESSASSPDLIRTITATAFGESPPARVAAAASRVCRMMTLKSVAVKMLFGLAGLVVVLSAVVLAAPDSRKPNAPVPTAPVKDDKKLIQGEWVFDAAEQQNGASHLSLLWPTVVTFEDGKVSIAHFQSERNNGETTFKIDQTKSPKQIDFALDERVRKMFAITGDTLPGVYKLDGDTLEICVAGEPGVPRPKEFKSGLEVKQARFVLKRKKPDVFPGRMPGFGVTVKDADGKPVEGAVIGFRASYRPKTEHADAGWHFNPLDAKRQPFRTDKDGKVVVPIRWQNKEVGDSLFVWHEERKLVAVDALSPARTMDDIAVTMKPAVKLSGTVTCPELTKAGYPIGPVNLSLEPTGQSAGRFSFNSFATDGRFEFFVPAGEYRLHTSGMYVVPQSVTVKTGAPAAVELKPTEFAKLLGKPAPEPKNVLGWWGAPVQWADLKGKVTVLTFWSWTDSATTATVRSLIPLHEKCKEKGLVVIGVHVGMTSEVIDTAKKLDDKLELIRFNWPPKAPKLTFPVMLTKNPYGFDSPRSRRPVGEVGEQYGLPAENGLGGTSVLIDKKGNVVGYFAHWSKDELAKLEKMLEEK
ncbi:MAG: sigma-70 family RNA polymerase sigma factor [Gemmataceae bacterium]